MLKESSYRLMKGKNARSTKKIAEPSKEILNFKVLSYMSMAHHFPQKGKTIKGALDTQDHHCKTKDSNLDAPDKGSS